MSKETFVFLLGTLVFFTSFLGLPREYKEWIFIVTGILLMFTGYRLRRAAYLRSLETPHGERRADAFAESVSTHKLTPPHHDSGTETVP